MDDDSSGDRGTAAQREEPPPEGEWRALLASVQRLTGVGAWSYDVSTGETWWSDQARELHGVDASRPLTFEDMASRYVETDESRVREKFSAGVEDCEPFTVDADIRGEGTTKRTVRLRCEPRAAGDEVAALYGTVRDVTDVKRREQRIEVLRRTSQRLKNASSRQEVAEIMADASKNILGLVNTTVRLVDERNEVLRTVVATEECVERAGERPDYSVSEETPAARTFRTGEPEIDANHQATEDDHQRGELLSGLYVPIGNHGVLSAGDVIVDAFTEQDLEAASLLGQLGAEAITRIGWAQRSRAI